MAVVGAGALVGAHGNHVDANPQVVADDGLMIESTFVTQDAHLVVHRNDDGEPGEIIGSVSVADGFHKNVRIALDSPPAGETTLWVVLHEDDGDGEFEPDEDPAMESFGSVAGTQVAVTPGDRAVYISAPSQTSQSVDDGSVRVERVAAPEDGHVVLRQIEDGEPGAVVGSAPVSAGTNENVTVEMNDSFVADQRQYFGVVAQLTTDDGDGEYGGEPAVTVGGEAVSTRLGLKKGGGSVSVNTAEPTATATESDADPESGSGGTLALPGFGAVVAVAALVALLAVAVRRSRD